jgi:Tat protein secretion system quality control protein TatD with DNase activity
MAVPHGGRAGGLGRRRCIRFDRGATAGGAAPAQGRNEPAELPRIAATLAELRGWSLAETAERTRANTGAALPRLQALLEGGR